MPGFRAPLCAIPANIANSAVFETITLAKVSFSAADPSGRGALAANDRITFNREQFIFDAKQTVLAMNLTGFRPTRPHTFRVGGISAFANLNAVL